MAAERAMQWAEDPARDQEWDRVTEALARLKSPPTWRILPDSLSDSRAKVVETSRTILVDEAFDRPLPTRGASVVELWMAVARLGAAANQALILGPPQH